MCFALSQNESGHITAHKVGYLNHYVDRNEPYSYYLYKLELTDKSFLNKRVTPYAMKFFEEIAHKLGYNQVFLDYRPDGIFDKNMYIKNENNKLEHRTSFLYRINGYVDGYDDNCLAQRYKRLDDNFEQSILKITNNYQGLVGYKNVKDWSKLQTQTERTLA